jgi:hypothetical protein
MQFHWKSFEVKTLKIEIASSNIELCTLQLSNLTFIKAQRWGN